MALTIYGSPRSRAMRTLWTVAELGLNYDHVPYAFDDPALKAPSFLLVNAAGSVPAIVDDRFALSESLAINLYLTKKYGSSGATPLYPQTLEREAEVWRWTLWAQAHLEPWVQGDALLADLRAAVGERAKGMIERSLSLLDATLGERRWLAAALGYGAGWDRPLWPQAPCRCVGRLRGRGARQQKHLCADARQRQRRSRRNAAGIGDVGEAGPKQLIDAKAYAEEMLTEAQGAYREDEGAAGERTARLAAARGEEAEGRHEQSERGVEFLVVETWIDGQELCGLGRIGGQLRKRDNDYGYRGHRNRGAKHPLLFVRRGGSVRHFRLIGVNARPIICGDA